MARFYNVLLFESLERSIMFDGVKVELKLMAIEKKEQRYCGTSLRAHLEAKGQLCTNCQQPDALCRCIRANK
jgi:hypothetical protein